MNDMTRAVAVPQPSALEGFLRGRLLAQPVAEAVTHDVVRGAEVVDIDQRQRGDGPLPRPSRLIR